MFPWHHRRHPIRDEELSAHIDGRLKRAARLEAHIEACADCRETLAQLRALRSALLRLPRAAAPRSFALREADVRPGVAPRPAGALVRAPALLGGLASIAFVSFLTLVSVDLATQPVEEGIPSVASEASMDAQAGEVSEAAAEGETGDKPPRRPRPAASQSRPECPPDTACPPGESAAPEPSPVAEAADDSRIPLRVGEAAAAAVALAAAGSLALVWWRRP